MKKTIAYVLSILFVSPFLLIGLCLYPLYGLFRGVTDKDIFFEYFDSIEKLIQVLIYPVSIWEDRMNNHKMIVDKMVYYRNLCKVKDSALQEYQQGEGKD